MAVLETSSSALMRFIYYPGMITTEGNYFHLDQARFIELIIILIRAVWSQCMYEWVGHGNMYGLIDHVRLFAQNIWMNGLVMETMYRLIDHASCSYKRMVTWLNDSLV